MEEEKLNELKKLSLEVLSISRQQLLMKYPFVGGILMHFEIVPIRDKRVRTAMTDGRHVYFDIAFLSELSEDERKFVLAHEAWHCIFMHFARLQTRDRNIFNMATDMEINRLLKNDGLIAPKDVLFPDSRMNDMSAEQIYEVLLKDMKNMQNCNSMSTGNYSGESSSKNSGSGKSNKINGQFDKHNYTNDDLTKGSNEDESGNKGISDKYGEVGYDPDFNPAISEDAVERIREMIVTEVQRAEKTRGTVPSQIAAYLDALRKPEISWKEVLAQFVTSCYNGKRRWLPPARRHVYNEIYLQSRRDEKINVVVAIDTSGSCSHELPKFFGELNGLLNSFGNYELTLIQCDAAVSDVSKWSQDDPFPEDPNFIKWSGGGGTSFSPPFVWANKNMQEIDCFVYFTDGFGSVDPMDGYDFEKFPPQYPVLWIITKNGDMNFTKIGQKIKFKVED